MHRQRVAAGVLLATLGACGGDAGPAGGGDTDAGTAADGGLVWPTIRDRPISPAPPPPLFRDATGDSGISLFVLSEKGIAGGAAVFDLDGDGALDLFFANEDAPSRMYRGRGDGTFEDVSETAGIAGVVGAMSAASADWDGDGDADLFVGANREDFLLRNDGGAFTDVTEEAGIAGRLRTPAADFGDVDGDGFVDLVLGDYEGTAGATNRLYRNRGDGTFESAGEDLEDGDMTLAVVLSDADADGDPDLLVANDYGMFLAPDRYYRNDSIPGDVRLEEIGAAVGFDQAVYGMGVAPIDYDLDGDLDYYVTNAFFKVLLENDGGSFRDVARESGAGAYGWDDPMQLFYPFPDPASCKRETDPAGCLSAMAYIDAYGDRETWLLGYTTFAPVASDFDHDGYEDLFLANGFVGLQPLMPEGRRQPDTLLLGGPDGFSEAPDSFGAADRGDGRGAAVGDFDGDGDVDLVVVNNGFDDELHGRVRIFENVGAAPGAFVRAHLVGAPPATDGIGAWVRADYAGATHLREVHGCAGFASCSDRTVHYGLGDADSIERLEIDWPSGTVDVLEDLPAGERIEVIEGSSPE